MHGIGLQPPSDPNPDPEAEAKAELHERRIFNYRLSRARRVVENTFGILAQKWRILRRPFKANDENVNRIIGACVALHNYLLKESTVSAASYCPVGLTDTEDWQGRLKPGSWRNDPPASSALVAAPAAGYNSKQYARTVRTKLAHHFVTAGAVLWQDDRIACRPQ
ncbi:uncharacterized protein LOC115312686 [Ixodes scapularis]|uniref:uncharacterized protein LOC115312686 n=1 Tax=Ixodes scapularis TaxID=6945 RepID=UPI001AD654E5|nr:uncharacterized protein LOC115312686 [Ixodes scapularis]